MDADELARISVTLVGAIAEAKALAKEVGIDAQFRELAQHAREMHDLLLEALIANEPLSTAYLHGLADSTLLAIENLEALAELPDGKMQ